MAKTSLHENRFGLIQSWVETLVMYDMTYHVDNTSNHVRELRIRKIEHISSGGVFSILLTSPM